jgi:phospholipid/cholesterol/gamma-HCH transport system substrate-binding protein
MANRNALVGIFVVIGLILFSVGIFFVGNRHEAFARHLQLYTEFANLDGLTNGSKVRVAGMDAGQIVEIGIPDSPSARFHIKFEISQTLTGMVREDSLVTIATEGIVGGTYLLIRPGTPQALPAARLSTLPSQEPVELSKLLDQSMKLLNDSDTTVKEVGGKVTDALDGITTTVDNVNDIAVGLKSGRGSVGMLLQDQELPAHIRQIIANVQQASSNLEHASGQANTLIADFQGRELPKKADETLDAAKDAAMNLDAGTKQVRQTITDALGTDRNGAIAATNISDSLSNLNAATASFADDTEALKHNFFIRGFFRNRGYYQLANLSAETYVKNRLFMNSGNYRAWLSATELFKKSSEGVEELSSAGKKSLDAAITGGAATIVGRPIIIEGYSNSSDPSDQLGLSRRRSILVRQYLQNHFELDAASLGVVSMKNAPEGLGHSSWDGVCIVVANGGR